MFLESDSAVYMQKAFCMEDDKIVFMFGAFMLYLCKQGVNLITKIVHYLLQNYSQRP